MRIDGRFVDEVCRIGTDEWVQCASDDARAWRGKEQEGLGGQNRVKSGEEQGEGEQGSPKSGASSGAEGRNGRSVREDLCCVRPPTGAYLTSQPEPENVKQLATSSLFSASESSATTSLPSCDQEEEGSRQPLLEKKSRSSCDDVKRSGKHRHRGNNAFDARTKRGSSSKKTVQASDRKVRKEIGRIVVSAVFSSKEKQREGKVIVDG